MSFDKTLESIVKGVDGAISAVMMGFDGIPIAKYMTGGKETDPEVLAIEFTRVIPEIVRTASTAGLGQVKEVTIAARDYFLLFLILPGNYFVTLLLKDGASLGKGRYLLKKSAPDILSEL